MISFIFNAIKIIFLLGFLVLIHEGGHFIVAKLCKVKVNEFAIGFGKTIWQKQIKETKYALRIIPLGGFVSMEGETEASEEQGSFTKASIPKRIAIVAAGALVNILFGILIYFILMTTVGIQFADPAKDTLWNRLYYGAQGTGEFLTELGNSVKAIFTHGISINEMTGPVGISEIVIQTTDFSNYIYIMAVISISLGITNLLPIPALDGGKILFLLIEAIRRKPLKVETEATIQMLGFSLLIALSLYVTYKDVIRIW